MTKEDIIKKAIDSLNRAKRLKLSANDIEDRQDGARITLEDAETHELFDVSIENGAELLNARLPGESEATSVNDLIMLRVAKSIFDAYKESVSAWFDKTIYKPDPLDGPAIASVAVADLPYDLQMNGRSLAATIDVIDDLRHNIKDLEERNAQLEQEVYNLLCAKEEMLDAMRRKGIM